MGAPGEERPAVEAVQLDELRPEWDALAQAAGNPFATLEWRDAWLEHCGVPCEPRIFATRDTHGSVTSILPLVVVDGRYVRTARLLGFGAANVLGPVAAPPDLEHAAAALRAAAEACRGHWDVFRAESLPGEGWDGRLRASLVARMGNPVVEGPWAGWDDYLSSRSSNFRQELRRKERKLAARGLEIRTVVEREALGPALDVLFALHRARWGDDAALWFAGREQLHRAFAAAALERGWLRLRLLELEERTIAAYLGYRFGDTEWFYQLGREPSVDAGSVGLVLVAHALRAAIEEGATTFDLGPGAQTYKLRFANGDRGLQTVGVAGSLRGRAALTVARRRAG
jgi:CelD/BcsL family acetyltransferase involved in cellulose biosynthesis